MVEDDRRGKSERLPTLAFGRKFTHVPEHVRKDLDSLQREGVLYEDLWIEELNDFRHVRVSLTPDEREDYARRSWAYELYIRAGCPSRVSEVSGVDADVAEYVDNYEIELRDGRKIKPWICFSAFMGQHLWSLSRANSERLTIIHLDGRERLLFDVVRTVQTLTPTIRAFNNREHGLAQWAISCEDDVRDLLYVMLRPLMFDLKKEEPLPSRAGTYKVVDLFSHSAELLIELKYIGTKGKWRKTIDEIHVDTQTYISHPRCKELIFVIVDAIRDIPDPQRLQAELSGEQTIGGSTVRIRVVIQEP